MINLLRNSAVGYRRLGRRLGPVLNVSNCENGNYDTFANGTPSGFDAISDGSETERAGTADEISVVANEKYVVAFDIIFNVGNNCYYNINDNMTGSGNSDEGQQLAIAGANEFEFTATNTRTCIVGFRTFSSAVNYEITNLLIKEIL